jgi:DNA-binding GntR family transcriptional regulator
MNAGGRTSTVDELAAKLSAAIVTGEIPIGAWLRQEALAERYGVSRQPVREALRQVQAAGLVEVFPNRGALVRGPSPQDIRDAYLVRAELEGLAAQLAVGASDGALVGRLDDALALFRTPEASRLDGGTEGPVHASDAWSRANDLFHQAIQEAAGVPALRRTIDDLHRIVPRNLTRSALRTPEVLDENLEQHERIRAAVAAGDPAEARAAMTEHVLLSGELIADWFEERQAGAAPPPARRRG